MNRLLKKRRQSGAGLYLFLIILLFLVPVTLTMIRKSRYQALASVAMTHMNQARGMAESVSTSFINLYSEDWHRNPFQTALTAVAATSFSGMGTAGYTINRVNGESAANVTTNAVRTSGGGSRGKGVDAMIFWANDIFKFDLVWPGNASLAVGGNVDPNIARMNNKNFNRTLYVGGNLNMGTVDSNLQSFFMVQGTVTFAGPTIVNNSVHCWWFNFVPGVGFGGLANVTNSAWSNPPSLYPNLKIIPPEGNDPSGSLGYYFTNATVSTAPVGVSTLRLTLNIGNYKVEYLNASGVSVFASLPTAYFPTVVTATVPWTFSSVGIDVWVNPSTIARPITVAVVGGRARVTGNVTYQAGAWPNVWPSATQSFALLSEGDFIIDPVPATAATPVLLSGFYGTTRGSISILGNRNLGVNGTLYGRIRTYQPLSTTTFDVRASTGLLNFTPPLFPRRPRVISWRNVQ